MFNARTFSLEETGNNPFGSPVHPVICGSCHQAQHQEPRRRSSPRSYAALAESRRRFRVIDWQGVGTTCCRCCGTRDLGERFTVEVQRA